MKPEIFTNCKRRPFPDLSRVKLWDQETFIPLSKRVTVAQVLNIRFPGVAPKRKELNIQEDGNIVYLFGKS
jgi:hypothetical protein